MFQRTSRSETDANFAMSVVLENWHSASGIAEYPARALVEAAENTVLYIRVGGYEED